MKGNGDMSRDRKALIVFYSATFAVSLVFDILYIVTKTDVFVVPLMWTPAVVGIVCGKKFYGKERNLGLKKRFKPVYIILGLLIPVIYLVPSYLIGWKILGDPTTGLDAIAKSFTGVDGINGTAFVLIAFIPAGEALLTLCSKGNSARSKRFSSTDSCGRCGTSR